MNKLVLLPALILLFGLSTGCATKQWVNEELGKMNERINKLESQGTAAAGQEVKKATEAAEQAQAAEKKAEEAAAEAAASAKKCESASAQCASAEKKAETAAEKAAKSFELMQKK